MNSPRCRYQCYWFLLVHREVPYHLVPPRSLPCPVFEWSGGITALGQIPEYEFSQISNLLNSKFHNLKAYLFLSRPNRDLLSIFFGVVIRVIFVVVVILIVLLLQWWHGVIKEEKWARTNCELEMFRKIEITKIFISEIEDLQISDLYVQTPWTNSCDGTGGDVPHRCRPCSLLLGYRPRAALQWSRRCNCVRQITCVLNFKIGEIRKFRIS